MSAVYFGDQRLLSYSGPGEMVFSYLQAEDLAHFSQTCKENNQLMQDKSVVQTLWKKNTEERFKDVAEQMHYCMEVNWRALYIHNATKERSSKKASDQTGHALESIAESACAFASTVIDEVISHKRSRNDVKSLQTFHLLNALALQEDLPPSLKEKVHLTLGQCHAGKVGSARKSDRKAFQHFKRSADLGSAEGQYEVALRSWEGKGTAQDAQNTFKNYRASALAQNPLAQYELALCYENGWGTPRDFTAAFEWYLASAKQGNRDAQFSVGSSYQYGLNGQSRNQKAAFEWYVKSAQQGHALAQYEVGVYFSDGGCEGVLIAKEVALEYFKYAAEQGHIKSLIKAGEILIDKWQDSKRPYCERQAYGKQALDYFQRASTKESVEAFYYLGMCYSAGIGVEVDYVQARSYFVNAAKLGCEDAQQTLNELDTFMENPPSIEGNAPKKAKA